VTFGNVSADESQSLPWEIPLSPELEKLRGYQWLLSDHYEKVKDLGLRAIVAITKNETDWPNLVEEILTIYQYDRALLAAAILRTGRPKRRRDLGTHILKGDRQYGLSVLPLVLAKDIPPSALEAVENARRVCSPDKFFMVHHNLVIQPGANVPGYTWTPGDEAIFGGTVYAWFGDAKGRGNWVIKVARWWDARVASNEREYDSSGARLFSQDTNEKYFEDIPWEVYGAPS
jgi:hypothetical protein